MISKSKVTKCIVFDIETAQLYSTLESAPRAIFDAWIYLCQKRNIPEEDYEKSWEEAPLYPEFSKITTISCSYLTEVGPDLFNVTSKSVCSSDEKEVLTWFVDNVASNSKYAMAGHNIHKFDMPFLNKRLHVNGFNIPVKTAMYEVKPWERTSVDTMEVWTQGVYGDRVSLDTLCMALNIPTPKYMMNGKDAPKYFHQGKLKELQEYCEGDTIATAKVLARLYNINAQFVNE